MQLSVLNVYSDDFTNNLSLYKNAVDTLEKLDIYNAQNDIKSVLTRRCCLRLLYRTMTIGKEKTIELSDEALLAFAYEKSLLTGDEIKEFELNKTLPWRESITLVERMLVSAVAEKSLYPESFYDNEWYEFSKSILLCSDMGSEIDGAGILYIPLDCGNNDTELYKFLEILYVSLHVPYINRNTGKCCSLIGKYLKLPDEPYKVTENVLNVNFTGNYSNYITRGEVLSLLLKCADEIAYGGSFNMFSDVFKSDNDRNIAEAAYRNGLLAGKVGDDGKIYAALDDFATWQEAITFADKLIFKNYMHNDYIDFEWAKLGESEAWFKLASKLGILNGNSNFFTRSIDLNVKDANKQISSENFLTFMYSVIHSPSGYSDYSPGYSWFMLDP